jgi:cAMP phosphodiesterase
MLSIKTIYFQVAQTKKEANEKSIHRHRSNQNREIILIKVCILGYYVSHPHIRDHICGKYGFNNILRAY